MKIMCRGYRWTLLAATAFLFTAARVPAQEDSPEITISRDASGVRVSWTMPGTLQARGSTDARWRDLIGAPRPFTTGSSNQQYFRAITRWAARTQLMEANSEMGVAELNGKIYVLGGYPASRITVRTVQVFDPAAQRWELTTPLPRAINHPMPAVANGKLYMIGGQTDAGNTSFVSDVVEFDPATTNWTEKAPMPTARSAGAAAVVGSQIYVAGGRPPRGRDFAVYDVLTDRWTTLTNMPTGRNHLAAGTIAGRIYVAGGRLGAGFTSPMTDVLEVYDPATDTWSTRTPMPTVRGGINGIVVDGCLFVFGGEGPDGVFEQNEMYVPELDRWVALEPLPTPVHGVTGAAYLDGWIHLPGGGTSTGGSSGSRIHQAFWVGGLCDEARRMRGLP
jgi:N-acetylneuraminic acid mutarotase